MAATSDFEQMWRDLAPVGRSSSSGGYFRQPWASAETELRSWFAEECAGRGLAVETDGIGNQVAWWEPSAASGARPDGRRQRGRGRSDSRRAPSRCPADSRRGDAFVPVKWSETRHARVSRAVSPADPHVG